MGSLRVLTAPYGVRSGHDQHRRIYRRGGRPRAAGPSHGLRRLRRRTAPALRRDRRAEIQAFMREIPVLDPRPADAMLGYDNFGLPN
jgi:hypothetical protein